MHWQRLAFGRQCCHFRPLVLKLRRQRGRRSPTRNSIAGCGIAEPKEVFLSRVVLFVLALFLANANNTQHHTHSLHSLATNHHRQPLFAFASPSPRRQPLLLGLIVAPRRQLAQRPLTPLEWACGVKGEHEGRQTVGHWKDAMAGLNAGQGQTLNDRELIC